VGFAGAFFVGFFVLFGHAKLANNPYILPELALLSNLGIRWQCEEEPL